MEPIEGVGTVFKMGDGEAIEVFSEVAEVVEIGEVSVSRGTIDVTPINDPDNYKKFIGAKMKDGGELGITLIWRGNEATQEAFKAKIDEVSPTNFQLVWPFSTPITSDFKALVTGYTTSTPTEDKMTLAVSLKISGKPVES